MDSGQIILIVALIVGGVWLVRLWSPAGDENKWDDAFDAAYTVNSTTGKPVTRGTASGRQHDPVDTIVNAAMQQLPRILESHEIFAGTSKDFRRKLSMIVGPEYAQAVAQLTAQQLEAVTKKLEIGQREALRVTKAAAVRASAPAIVAAQTDTLGRLFAIRENIERQHGHRPEELALFDAVIGKQIADMLNSGLDTPMTDAIEVARFLSNGYAKRQQKAQELLGEIEAQLAQGRAPSEIAGAAIFQRRFDEHKANNRY